jgi:hypothetical protein
MPEKNEEIEQSIPVQWRPVIIEVVEDIRSRNVRYRNVLGCDVSVDFTDIEDVYQSLDNYGDVLVAMPEDTWNTSICRWMGSY